MGFFDLIRAMFGLSGSKDTDGTDVDVEYDPGSEPVDTERSDDDQDEEDTSGTRTERGETDDAVAAGTDATASTDSMTAPSDDPETAAEPAEAGAGVTEHSGTETPAAEPAEATGPVPDEPDAEIDAEATPEAETEPDDTASEDAEPDDSPSDEAATEPVDTVSGIGSAYADRLAGADVETVEQLLEADPEALADRADISEKRIRRWQENASGD